MLTRRAAVAAILGAPAFVRAQRPVTSAVMAGDPVALGNQTAAMVWARADRPARMIVEWRTSERGEARRIAGPHTLSATDFTGRVELTGLPSGQTILYSVQFEDLANNRTLSEPVRGTLRTPPTQARNIRFLWGGDVVGQGFGINPEWGGMRTFETMQRLEPDFFLHSGDTIYADGPLQAEISVPGGTWRNVVTPEKAKVAETLDEFRGNHRYNLLDEHYRNFIASIAQVWQWDDHEVMNNWSPSKSVAANRQYTEKSVPLMVANATRAFLEYAPIRPSAAESERVYRKISYGPLLDLFVVDLRSYRGPNTYNLQTTEGEETRFFGREQMAWLMQGLRDSRATWKAIACDMPIGLLVADGNDAQGRRQFEAFANADNGAPSGRELEVAALLRFLKQNRIRNLAWFTADVHYTAAHYYDPRKARFTEFDPFWEFVSGPLNAGTGQPLAIDTTFGIEVRYQKGSPGGMLPPSAGMQFFGDVLIDARTRAMSVTLRDVSGAELFKQVLPAG